MARLYIHAADFIRQQPFEVRAPAFYHPMSSSDDLDATPPVRPRVNRFYMVGVKQLNPTPFRAGVDPTVLQNSAYTVEIMIDMFRKQIEFEIVNDIDIPTIFDGLDRYLISLEADVNAGVEVSVAYAKLVIAWRTEVYKHYYRYMKLNPTAMAELYTNHDPERNIFSLLARINGGDYGQFKADPLRARMKPPISIDAITPLTQDGGSVEDTIGSSLGLSSQKQPVVTDTKFDYQNFLNKG